MGFFNRFTAKGASPASRPADQVSVQPPAAAPAPEAPAEAERPAGESGGAVRPRLAAARGKLDARDLPGALVIYEEVLAAAGDRADVLVTISADLGSTGHVAPIIDLIAPRYDAARHGPATGLNLLQAYLAARDPEAAQHILDILFSLQRPELEERLYGFSNAIAELMAQGVVAGLPDAPAGPPAAEGAPVGARVTLVSISKPIWFYGLESLADEILPTGGRPRRIAFAQLALPNAYPDLHAAMKQPEDELGRLARGLPLWLAETFFFSPLYAPIAAVGIADEADGSRHPALFPSEWTIENLRQLVDSTTGGLDYIYTGALREKTGDYELILRVWEVRKYRERKQFTAKWTAATADAELARLSEEVRGFMEWAPFPEGQGLAYAPPASPRAWIDALALSLGLFLAEKKIQSTALMPPLAAGLDAFAPHAFSPPAASLAWLTLRQRAAALSLDAPLAEVLLSPSPLVARARAALHL